MNIVRVFFLIFFILPLVAALFSGVPCWLMTIFFSLVIGAFITQQTRKTND